MVWGKVKGTRHFKSTWPWPGFEVPCGVFAEEKEPVPSYPQLSSLQKQRSSAGAATAETADLGPARVCG